MLDCTREAARAATLASYDIMDTPREAEFDAIVAAASECTAAPIATISLVDETRQWFKAKLGIDDEGGPIATSFCAAAVRAGEDVFVVEDASRDARFSDYDNVTGGPGIRFYAGMPLRVRNGERIGTLCVIDVEPRAALLDDERAALERLAKRTVEAFELRRDLRDSGMLASLNAGDEAWLDLAHKLLARAAAALDHVEATLPLAHLERVIDDVARLRTAAAQGAPA